MICEIANISTTLDVPSTSDQIIATTEMRNNSRTLKNYTFSSTIVEKTSFSKSHIDATIVTMDRSNSTATRTSVSNKIMITYVSTHISSVPSQKVPMVNVTTTKNRTDMNGCQDWNELKRIG